MSDIIPFDFEEQAVRVVMRDDEPWFVASDICRVLEIANPSDAVSRLDDDEKGVATTDTLGGQQQARIISESGLYALIFTSRKEAAKRFRKWVTSEVLPAIRRTGRYDQPGLPAAPEATGDIAGLTFREAELWLTLVREARLTRGTRASAALWARSPLPPLDARAEPLRDPAEGRACVEWLLAHAAARLVPQLVGNAEADAGLKQQGLRLLPSGLFVGNAAPIFNGSRWAAGLHVPVLRSLHGVEADSTPRTLSGVAMRGLVVPFIHLAVEEECDA